MAELLDQLKSYSKQLGKTMTDFFKKDEGHPIKVRDLAYLISEHQESRKKTKELLGLVFNFYKLNMGPITFKLETKGKYDEYILDLSVRNHGEEIFSYKAYDDDHSLKDKHALPEAVYSHLHQ